MGRMILTVTPHPALDYSLRLDGFEMGRRARYGDAVIDPSGKGVNVARMVRRLGEPVLALGFAAGLTGDLLAEGLDAEGVPHDFVRIEGRTRINVTLLTGREGLATHFHGPGTPVGPDDVRRLVAKVRERLAGARMLVLSGSLPPGMPPGTTADLLRAAREAGVPAVVDAEGEPLAAALEAGPAVAKPNRGEAARLLGLPLEREDDVRRAAAELTRRGAAAAVITMGGDGAIAVKDGRAWRVRTPREEVVRAVGAGDSFAAGLAVGLARGAGMDEALRLAAAAGAATARAPGSSLGAAEAVARLREAVVVEPLG